MGFIEKDVTTIFMKDYLIENSNYTKILEIVGLSPKPISAYKINKEFTIDKIKQEKLNKKKVKTQYEKIDNQFSDKLAERKNELTQNELVQKNGKRKWPQKKNQYTYKMVKELRPDFLEDYYTYFFNWKKILHEHSEKKIVIEQIKNIFKVDLRESSSNNSFNQQKDILPTFSKSEDDKIIKIANPFTTRDIEVTIKRTRLGAELIVKQDSIKKKVSLYIKNDCEVYFPKRTKIDDVFYDFNNKFYKKRPYFLDIIEEIDRKKKMNKKENQILPAFSIKSDINYQNRTINVPENGLMVEKPLKDYLKKWEYHLMQNLPKTESELKKDKNIIYTKKYMLNIRGLILYILFIVPLDKNTSKKSNNIGNQSNNLEGPKYRKHISNVLENLSENYISTFDFLLYYKSFKNIFKEVIKNPDLVYHEVDILIAIAKEHEKQIWFDDQYFNLNIETNDDVLINLSVAKRYFSEISYYFGYLSQFLDDETYKEFTNLFKDYQKRMLTLIRDYLEKGQNSVKNLLDEFESNSLLVS